MPRLPNGAKAPKKKKPAPKKKASTAKAVSGGGRGGQGRVAPKKSLSNAASSAVKSYEGAVDKLAPDGSPYKDGKLKNPGAQRIVKGGKGEKDSRKVVGSTMGRGGKSARGKVQDAKTETTEAFNASVKSKPSLKRRRKRKKNSP